MVWSKLADEVLDHPKVARAGVIGWAVWSASIVWSNRNLTDGHIPRAAARRLLDLSELLDEVLGLIRAPSGFIDKAARETSDLPPVRVDEIAARLVECGLWEATDDGWRIHDFLDHNPSREQVEAARRAKAEAGRVGASRRWGMAPAIGAAMAPAKHMPKQTDGRAIAEPVANRWQNDAPDPDPDPDPRSLSQILRTSDPVEPDADSAPKRKRKPDPLPFAVLDALGAIAAEAGGDFPAVEARDLTGGTVIQIQRAIRAYPEIGLWALVGRFVRAGGVPFPPPPLAPSWVASGRFREAMAAARAWDAAGGGPIERRSNGKAAAVSAHPGKKYDVGDAPW